MEHCKNCECHWEEFHNGHFRNQCPSCEKSDAVYEADKLQKENTELKDIRDELENAVSELKSEIEEKEERISCLEDEISTLESDIQECKDRNPKTWNNS